LVYIRHVPATAKVPYFTKLDSGLRDDLRQYKAAQGVPEAEQIDRALRAWFNSRRDLVANIGSEYRNQLDSMTALHDTVLGIMRSPWTIGKPGLNRAVFTTIVSLLSKACKTFKSIQSLCERGLHEDANALARVLLETTAAIEYILQNKPIERSTIFYAHSLHQQIEMLRDWKRSSAVPTESFEPARKRAETEFNRIMKSLPQGTDAKRHWSGLSGLKAVLKALGDETTYATGFRFGSSMIHVTDFGAHFEPDGDSGDVVFQPEGRVRGFGAPSYAARQLLWRAADRINDRFGLGFEAKLGPFHLTDEDVKAGKK
jgi:hypothetical protein